MRPFIINNCFKMFVIIIYAKEYLQFSSLHIRSLVCMLICYVKVLIKVSPEVYISVTTDQNAFSYPRGLALMIHIMTSDPRVPAPGWGWRSKSKTPLKGRTKFWLKFLGWSISHHHHHSCVDHRYPGGLAFTS